MISRFGEVRGRLRAGTKPEPEKTCLEDGFWPRFPLQKESKMASKVVPGRSRIFDPVGTSFKSGMPHLFCGPAECARPGELDT
jgi:hypothetical protein